MNKIIQDMIPKKNKPPLREVIPVEKPRVHIEKKRPIIVPEKSNSNEEPLRYESDFEPQRPPSTKTRRGIVGKRTVKPWLFAIIALICVLAIAYAFSIVYARATVTITPASILIPVDGNYIASANAASGTLGYQIIQTNSQLTQNVPATTGSIVTTYAKGTVILYNNYSSASQKIVAGTRLESGNGLIYTTNTSVVIPGITKGVAGSIPVAVTAAAGGSSYNILPSDLTINPSYGDFSIVAYKGTAKDSGFYGRLNPAGAGITGGSSGHQIIISSSTVSASDQTMQQTLQKNLLAQALALVPAGYVMFSNSYNITYNPINASTTSSTTANVGMQASFSGIIFKKTALAQAIAPTQYSSSFDPQGLDTIDFTITNPATFSVTNGQPLDFSLKGNMNLVGIISTSTLITQLAGISLSQSVSVFKGYSAIASVHATILPFWKHSFPSSPSRITIVIQSN